MTKLNALSVALASCLMAACGGSTVADPAKAEGGSIRVIVADIDSTINPYHDYLYAGSAIYKDQPPSAVTQDVLDELGVPPENVVTLTRTGNLLKDRQADAAFWNKVRRNKPYHFKGTNVVALSICPENFLEPDASDPNKDPHGVGTSSSVLTANPEAVLFFIEMCADVGADAAHDIAFLHPAVDIITTSYGAGVPTVGFPLPEASTFRNTFEGVVTLGKMHFSSGGNGSGLTNKRAGAGPWWSIGVSGFEEYTADGDQQGFSGNFPDFVSDFSQDIPYTLSNEKDIDTGVSGTSFSTPRAAGVASRVLLEARRALGHTGGIRLKADALPVMAEGNGKVLTNWDIRRALEEGAYAGYGPGDYDPNGATSDNWPTSLPVNPVAPWLQIGWGDLSSDPAKEVVLNSLAALGLATGTRTKPSDFCDFQTKIIEERILYWGTAAIDSGDHQVDSIPFVFCGSALPPLPSGAEPLPESPVDAGLPVDVSPACTDVLDPTGGLPLCSAT